MTNFYELLSVAPTASAEEIKNAFRVQIARYHPDKVQHLGSEFQQMAAERAAALTEAYRTLTDPERRSEYDRKVKASIPSHPSHSVARSEGVLETPALERPKPVPASPRPSGGRFASERRDLDDLVKRATITKFRNALTAEVGQVDESASSTFDLDCSTKSKGLFQKNGVQGFAMKLVNTVDRDSVRDAWIAAARRRTPICVFLLGNSMASPADLADAIADLKKKWRDAAISIIPVDLRDWAAYIPTSAPSACKRVVARLKEA